MARVLNISTIPFTYTTGSGALMCAMFGDWGRDKLACIYSGDYEIESEVCGNARRVEYSSALSGKFDGFSMKAILPSMRDFSLSDLMRRMAFKQKFDDAIYAAEEMLMRFKPDCIYHYVLGRNFFMSLLAREISRRHSLPLIVHMMDDWPALQCYENVKDFRGGESHDMHQCIHDHWMELFEFSNARLCISDRMQQEYASRYGLKFTPLANAIDVSSWEHRENYVFQDEVACTVVYAGSITEKEIEGLLLFRDAFLEVAGENDNVQWHIYAGNAVPAYLESLLVDGRIKVKQQVSWYQYSSVLAQADILLMSLSFDDRTRRYLSLSMQNKTPEYMASGNAILAIGPSELATIEYALQQKWALTVTENDTRAVTDAFRNMLTDQRLRERLGRRARELAVRNHDLGVMRSHLREIVTDVVCYQ